MLTDWTECRMGGRTTVPLENQCNLNPWCLLIARFARMIFASFVCFIHFCFVCSSVAENIHWPSAGAWFSTYVHSARPLEQSMQLTEVEQFENAYVTRNRAERLVVRLDVPHIDDVKGNQFFVHTTEKCLIFKLFVNHLHPSKINLSAGPTLTTFCAK